MDASLFFLVAIGDYPFGTRTLHFATPGLCFYNRESGIMGLFSLWSEAEVDNSPTSYLFPPFFRRTIDTFVNLERVYQMYMGQCAIVTHLI